MKTRSLEGSDRKTMLGNRTARDGEEFVVRSNGGDWLTAWHSPIEVPAGTPHGANAFCVTADDQVVLISNDGVHWGGLGADPRVVSPGSKLFAARSWKRRVPS